MNNHSKLITTPRILKALVMFFFFSGCLLLYSMLETEHLPDLVAIVKAAAGGALLTGMLIAILFINPLRNMVKWSMRNIVTAIIASVFDFFLVYVVLYFFAAERMDWPAIFRISISTGIICGIIFFYTFRSTKHKKVPQHAKKATQA